MRRNDVADSLATFNPAETHPWASLSAMGTEDRRWQARVRDTATLVSSRSATCRGTRVQEGSFCDSPYSFWLIVGYVMLRDLLRNQMRRGGVPSRRIGQQL